MHPGEILRPIIGQWYYDRTNDREFEVLNIDKEEGILEIQYLEGEVEEVDLDTWEDMNLAKIAEPAEWDHDGEDKEELDDLNDIDDEDPDDWETLNEDEDDDWQE